MAAITTEQLIIASLMREPKKLLEMDKYQLNKEDFDNNFYRTVFWAIRNLAPKAERSIAPHEIENFLNQHANGKALYDTTNGNQILIDSLAEIDRTETTSFEVHYETLKKENLIRDLKKNGINVDDIYLENNANVDPVKKARIQEEYANATPVQLLEKVEQRYMKIKSMYSLNDTSECQSAASGARKYLEKLKEMPEIGLPFQGKYFSTISSGALMGKFYLRSGQSGIGKTRNSVADACYWAYPIRYDWATHKWIDAGYGEKILFIITEQTFEEVDSMILSYLSGINERRIKQQTLNPEEEKILGQTLSVMEYFDDNFQIIRVPNPNITIVQQLVREQVKLLKTRYVFYDYVFINPALVNEFRGMNLRNDEILLMFSDALKKLAVELNIFIMSSTQVNSKADDNNQGIRNESSLAGSRAIINKADLGCIMTRPSVDDLKALKDVCDQYGREPNMVTDFFKVRGGEYTQVRLWSYADLGTMKRVDLFVTDAQYQAVDIDLINWEVEDEDLKEVLSEARKELNI